jgi:hypothetical protein
MDCSFILNLRLLNYSISFNNSAVSNDLERGIYSLLEACVQNLHGKTEENYILSQAGRHLSLDLNRLAL